jgi:hypothetical protein
MLTGMRAVWLLVLLIYMLAWLAARRAPAAEPPGALQPA